MALTDRVHRTTEENETKGSMTLTEHLAELRTRLLISTAAFLILAVVAFFFYDQILSWLRDPYCRANHGNCTLYVTSPLDGLALRLKVSAFGGLLLSLPVLFFELWRFITPGLKRKERRYALPFAAASAVLFLAGCALAYVSFEHALVFLASIGGPSLQQIYNPNQYLSLILLMMFLFGLTFEFPVVLVALQLARIITPAQLLSWWRWAIIGITAGAAIFTPSGDPFSMLAMMVPLIAFYFLAIVVGKLARR